MLFYIEKYATKKILLSYQIENLLIRSFETSWDRTTKTVSWRVFWNPMKDQNWKKRCHVIRILRITKLLLIFFWKEKNKISVRQNPYFEQFFQTRIFVQNWFSTNPTNVKITRQANEWIEKKHEKNHKFAKCINLFHLFLPI